MIKKSDIVACNIFEANSLSVLVLSKVVGSVSASTERFNNNVSSNVISSSPISIPIAAIAKNAALISVLETITKSACSTWIVIWTSFGTINWSNSFNIFEAVANNISELNNLSIFSLDKLIALVKSKPSSSQAVSPGSHAVSPAINVKDLNKFLTSSFKI